MMTMHARLATATLAVLVVGVGPPATAAPRSNREPRIFVANRTYPPAPAVHVAVVPFAVPSHDPRWGREAARVARKRFQAHDFDIVPRKIVQQAVEDRKLSPKEMLSDETLCEIGKQVEADWVVHGRLMNLGATSPKFLGLPLPSQRNAKCALETRVVEVKTGELLYRNEGSAKGDVGSQWSTDGYEARHRIIERAGHRLYDPLFERIPKLSADLYKRRAYVSDDAVYIPEETRVAVLPFVDLAGEIKHELVVTGAARDAFKDEGFEIVDPDKVDYALSQRPHDVAEDHSDAALAQLGGELDARLVVYGEIMNVRVENKRLPGASFKFPVPARKEASAVLKTQVLDVASRQIVYRSQRKADDPVAGVEYLTRNAAARGRTLEQCVRYLFADFFEACVEG
jgi:TolB-like protein